MVKLSKPAIILVVVYVVSRLWLASIGVTFDDYRHPRENFVGIMQMYPMEAMGENLWETIWYNHSQPPMYSLVMWATGMNDAVVHLSWVALSLTALLAIFYICLGLELGNITSLAVATAWMLSPATILYENTIIYTYPVACLLIIASWALLKQRLLLFSVLCCSVTLTRSLFHPLLWMLPMLWLGWRTRK